MVAQPLALLSLIHSATQLLRNVQFVETQRLLFSKPVMTETLSMGMGALNNANLNLDTDVLTLPLNVVQFAETK